MDGLLKGRLLKGRLANGGLAVAMFMLTTGWSMSYSAIV
jgi:hypothetical protein